MSVAGEEQWGAVEEVVRGSEVVFGWVVEVFD